MTEQTTLERLISIICKEGSVNTQAMQELIDGLSPMERFDLHEAICEHVSETDDYSLSSELILGTWTLYYKKNNGYYQGAFNNALMTEGEMVKRYKWRTQQFTRTATGGKNEFDPIRLQWIFNPKAKLMADSAVGGEISIHDAIGYAMVNEKT